MWLSFESAVLKPTLWKHCGNQKRRFMFLFLCEQQKFVSLNTKMSTLQNQKINPVDSTERKRKTGVQTLGLMLNDTAGWE